MRIKRPRGHVKLDSSNPIVKMMTCGWDANLYTGTTLLDQLGGRGITTDFNQGTTNIINTEVGKALDFTGTNYIRYNGTDRQVNTGYPFCVFTRVIPKFNGSDPILGTGVDSSRNPVVEVRQLSNNTMQYSGRISGGTFIANGGSFTAGDVLDVVGISRSSNDHRLYVNGVFIASTSVNRVYNIKAGQKPMVGYGVAAGSKYDGQMAWAYWLDGNLTDAQILSLHKDPYQIYEPEPSEFLVSSSVPLQANTIVSNYTVAPSVLGRLFSGKVTLRGNAVQNASIYVYNNTDGTLDATQTSDVLGDWSFQAPLGKSYVFVVEYTANGFKYTSNPHFVST